MSSLIKLKNVNKYYNLKTDSLHVLKSINFKIEEGDFLIIMGKSGSGKTTLLNLLGLLDSFDDGEYLLKGQNVELPLLYKGGVPKKEREMLVNKHLDLVGLKSKKNRMPSELSGGQQQRIAIARAMINNPSVIFADEPTGALDSETGIEIMRILKKLNEEKKTIIMVTHDRDLAKYANKIIMIKDGVASEVNNNVAN